MNKKRVLIAGAGGFIGGHLVKELLSQGHSVRAVDIKPFEDWYQKFDKAENIRFDLQLRDNCVFVTRNIDEVYNLAADMGGMGFIEKNKALCMISVLINTHLLIASTANKVQRYFYASSACVYNGDKQKETTEVSLKESDAYPAMAEDGYGWEKLFSERMCRHFTEDFGIETRVARFHNVYGPFGTYDGGREKAPAAICRKVIEAKISGNKAINIWGDGKQTRSFMYIDDCIKGILKIMESDIREPLNLGRDDLISINELVNIVEKIADIKLARNYELSAPKGVRGRNSDNTLIRKLLKWQPSISMETGLKKTYKWIWNEILAKNVCYEQSR
jgi:GDP-D-mannose 3',5'-epimerase